MKEIKFYATRLIILSAGIIIISFIGAIVTDTVAPVEAQKIAMEQTADSEAAFEKLQMYQQAKNTLNIIVTSLLCVWVLFVCLFFRISPPSCKENTENTENTETEKSKV